MSCITQCNGARYADHCTVILVLHQRTQGVSLRPYTRYPCGITRSIRMAVHA